MASLWTPYGPRMDPVWTPMDSHGPHGHPMDPLWTPYGPPMDPMQGREPDSLLPKPKGVY